MGRDKKVFAYRPLNSVLKQRKSCIKIWSNNTENTTIIFFISKHALLYSIMISVKSCSNSLQDCFSSLWLARQEEFEFVFLGDTLHLAHLTSQSSLETFFFFFGTFKNTITHIVIETTHTFNRAKHYFPCFAFPSLISMLCFYIFTRS